MPLNGEKRFWWNAVINVPCIKFMRQLCACAHAIGSHSTAAKYTWNCFCCFSVLFRSLVHITNDYECEWDVKYEYNVRGREREKREDRSVHKFQTHVLQWQMALKYCFNSTIFNNICQNDKRRNCWQKAPPKTVISHHTSHLVEFFIIIFLMKCKSGFATHD